MPELIRADGTGAVWPPSAAVAAAIQDCANSALSVKADVRALAEALAAWEGVEKERIHTACCAFAILMRDGVADQRLLLRPTVPDEQTICLRDFSRFSLAGINACYCIAPPEKAERLNALGIPAPDRCACAAAAAAVRDRENAQKRIAATEGLRRESAERLRKLGFPCAEGEGAWIDIPAADPGAFAGEMLAHGVAVGREKGEVRLWLCAPEAMERIFFILQKERTRKSFRVRN